MPQVCSFCGRSKEEVDLMISGINAHICNHCIEQSVEILSEDRKLRQQSLEPKFNLLKPLEINSLLVWALS